MTESLSFAGVPTPSAVLTLFGPVAAQDLAPLAPGLSLPTPLQAAAAGNVLALWLGPETWLVAVTGEPAEATENRWRAALGESAVVVGMGDAWRRFRLAGAGWRAALSGPMPFDLTNQPPGRCLRSVLHGVPVLLHLIEDAVLDLWTPRSYAAAVNQRLQGSARQPQGGWPP